MGCNQKQLLQLLHCSRTPTHCSLCVCWVQVWVIDGKNITSHSSCSVITCNKCHKSSYCHWNRQHTKMCVRENTYLCFYNIYVSARGLPWMVSNQRTVITIKETTFAAPDLPLSKTPPAIPLAHLPPPSSCHFPVFSPVFFKGVLGSDFFFFCLPEKVRRSILCFFFFFLWTMLGDGWSWRRRREKDRVRQRMREWEGEIWWTRAVK